MQQSFSNFYAVWKDKLSGHKISRKTRSVYLETARDRSGFDILPDFIARHGEQWAVDYATCFESTSGIAARADQLELTKFRMVFDRHIANLVRGTFDDDYITTSDERTLFLLYHRVPPLRICAALNKSKNSTLDFIIAHADGEFAHQQMALFSAMSTLFMIETNHIMRGYVLFDRVTAPVESRYQYDDNLPNDLPDGYNPPTRNAQLTLPDAAVQGSIEMF